MFMKYKIEYMMLSKCERKLNEFIVISTNKNWLKEFAEAFYFGGNKGSHRLGMQTVEMEECNHEAVIMSSWLPERDRLPVPMSHHHQYLLQLLSPHYLH